MNNYSLAENESEKIGGESFALSSKREGYVTLQSAGMNELTKIDAHTHTNKLPTSSPKPIKGLSCMHTDTAMFNCTCQIVKIYTIFSKETSERVHQKYTSGK